MRLGGTSDARKGTTDSRLAMIGAGLAVLGLAVGWLTAPRRGPLAQVVRALRSDEHVPLDSQGDLNAPADVVIVPSAADAQRPNGARAHPPGGSYEPGSR